MPELARRWNWRDAGAGQVRLGQPLNPLKWKLTRESFCRHLYHLQEQRPDDGKGSESKITARWNVSNGSLADCRNKHTTAEGGNLDRLRVERREKWSGAQLSGVHRLPNRRVVDEEFVACRDSGFGQKEAAREVWVRRLGFRAKKSPEKREALALIPIRPSTGSGVIDSGRYVPQGPTFAFPSSSEHSTRLAVTAVEVASDLPPHLDLSSTFCPIFWRPKTKQHANPPFPSARTPSRFPQPNPASPPVPSLSPARALSVRCLLFRCSA